MGVIDNAVEYLVNLITDGKFHLTDNIAPSGIRPAFDRVKTSKRVIKYFYTYSIPVDNDIRLTSFIRDKMQESFPRVLTAIRLINTPEYMNVMSDKYQQPMRLASQQYEQAKAFFEKANDSEKEIGFRQKFRGITYKFDKEDLDRMKNRADSFKYLYSAVNRGSELFMTKFIIEAHFLDHRDIKAYRKTLQGVLAEVGCSYHEIKGKISKFLKEYGAAAPLPDSKNKMVLNRISTDENLAFLSPFADSGISNIKGAFMGIDWVKKVPLLLDFMEAPTAQVMLMLARSGEGKTFTTFHAVLSHIHRGVHHSVIDLKGNEWVRVADKCNSLIISMNNYSTRFVNTLRLDDIEVNDGEEARELYDMAFEATKRLFLIMAQKGDEHEASLGSFIGKAVNKTFSKAGVKANEPGTFKNTKNLNLEDVLENMHDLKTSPNLTPEQINLYTEAISFISPFLDRTGVGSGSGFTDEITIGEILSKELVIYSLDKNKNGDLGVMDTLKMFMISHLDSKKHFIRKKQGLHTGIVYEELTRAPHVTNLVKEIEAKVTGSRSENVMVWLLLNSVELLDKPQFASICGNITTMFVGKINKKDRETVQKLFDASEIEEFIEMISTEEVNADNANSENLKSLKNTFAVKYNTGARSGYTIMRVVAPRQAAEQFRTRDIGE